MTLEITYTYGSSLPQTATRGRPRRFEHEEVKRLRTEGLTFATISERLGCSVATARYACRDMPTVKTKRPPRGASPARRADPVEALRLLGEGLTLAAIGENFGVTRERIRQIAAAHGLTSSRARDKKRAVRERLYELISQGKSDATITRVLPGAGEQAIVLARRHLGLQNFKPEKAKKRKKLEPMVDLVRQGRSIRSVEMEHRLTRSTLLYECRRLGVVSQAGSRWADHSHRHRLVPAMRAKGCNWTEITRAVSAAEGRPISAHAVNHWARNHYPELFPLSAKP